jgi:hypothetical protein
MAVNNEIKIILVHMSIRGSLVLPLILMVGMSACDFSPSVNYLLKAPQWEEITLELTASDVYGNPYTDVDVYAVFKHNDFGEIKRPAFWDGEKSWKIRFASPVSDGTWNWESFCSNTGDSGLHGVKGQFVATTYTGDNSLIRKGLLRMSEGKRNVVHADGTTFLVVGDTPWALPWRATYEDVHVYARDRQSKGFNAALLMTICPDRHAQGPDARTTEIGFARSFKDIEGGHINEPIIPYFQYMDSLMKILIAHEIVPVYQPVFHGFGWKNLQILGWDMVPEEYARYCRYLVARYGAQPAIWLVSADSDARFPGVLEGGEEIGRWDAYGQPTGLHYSRFDDYGPTVWNRSYEYVPHLNKIHHDKDWLDFQWCQTGHWAENQFHKVERMYDNKPVKGTANGESTYEGMGDPDNGAGWWQGQDAWGQLMHGGTMGVFYGAGGLWNWKITADEEGWPSWANSLVSWKGALDLTGSTYVGYIGQALKGLDMADIQRVRDQATGYFLAKTGKVYIAYLEEGGEISLDGLKSGLPYEWFNPKTGEVAVKGSIAATSQVFRAPDSNPWVLIVGKRR